MTQNALEVRIAGNGGLFVAALGSTLPTDAESPLDAAFVDLGLATEEGVKITPDRTVEKIRAWQSRQPVRTAITAEDIALSMELMQWNPDTVPT